MTAPAAPLHGPSPPRAAARLRCGGGASPAVQHTVQGADRPIVIVQVYPLAWLFITSLRTEHDFATGDPFERPNLTSRTTPGPSRPATSG